MEIKTFEKISKLVGQIEDIANEELGPDRKSPKIMIDENEVTFSFTRKGHRSSICNLPKEKWGK